MHYKEMVEQKTGDTHDQIKAKEEEINTAAFKSGKYATLCRGNTSQVPVPSLFFFISKKLRCLRTKFFNLSVPHYDIHAARPVGPPSRLYLVHIYFYDDNQEILYNFFIA